MGMGIEEETSRDGEIVPGRVKRAGVSVKAED